LFGDHPSQGELDGKDYRGGDGPENVEFQYGYDWKTFVGIERNTGSQNHWGNETEKLRLRSPESTKLLTKNSSSPSFQLISNPLK
jgi:hypothetical protein